VTIEGCKDNGEEPEKQEISWVFLWLIRLPFGASKTLKTCGEPD